MKKRVVVGLSGGVDSSVAAYLLKEQGYDVVGLFMRNWKGDDEGVCTAADDYADVRQVADKLDIPFYTVDFSAEYMQSVFSLFVDYYKKGLTPNPDVLCNREIKFGVFAERARELDADFIATGHYCDTESIGGRVWLKRAADENKDQTYFLNQVTENQISNVLFPLGGLLKPKVREIAHKLDLVTAAKKDSTGICFIGERKFREFLSKYIPMKRGDIVDLDGKKVGEHSGVYYYTVGQRHGLGIGGAGNGEAWFVLKKDVLNNRLIVSQGEDGCLFSSSLETDGFNFITEPPARQSFRCTARIRHRQSLQSATAYVGENGVKVEFDSPQRAVAAGQYAVLYQDNLCIGGGEIK